MAIPHGRSARLATATGTFLRLAEPVDFNAPDGQPVDLVFALVVPEHFAQQHLMLLANLAEMFGDADFQITQVNDVLVSKLVKRGVDTRFLDAGKVEKIGGDKVKQVVKVKNGVSTEDGKKIQQVLKGSKLKVQGAIQGDAVRVTGAKRDDLQAAMALIKSELKDLPLSFNNFRD